MARRKPMCEVLITISLLSGRLMISVSREPSKGESEISEYPPSGSGRTARNSGLHSSVAVVTALFLAHPQMQTRRIVADRIYS